MKTLISNYTFNKTSKQVTFNDYNSILLSCVLLITNVTKGVIIYNFADALKGGTVELNILTLTYNTASMSDSDSLQIYYDDLSQSADVIPLANLITTLQELSARLSSLAGTVSHVQPAIRTIPLTSVSTAVTGTLAVSSIANFGTGIPAKEMVDDMNNMVVTLANINNATV